MFDRFYLTAGGKSILTQAQAGANIQYAHIEIGEGALSEYGQSAMESMSALVKPLGKLPIASVELSNKKALVSAQFSNRDHAKAFYFREAGLYAKDPSTGRTVLYAYANAGDKADYVPASSDALMDFSFSFSCSVGNAENLTLEADDSRIFVTRNDVIDIAHGGTGASDAGSARKTLEITPENISAAERYHSHGAADIASGTLPITRGGTGAVNASAARSALGITPSAIGAANTSHSHGAADIASGAVSVARGGTGATTAAAARSALGVTPGNIGAVSKGGDTMSGTLRVPYFVVEKDSWPGIGFANAAGQSVGGLLINTGSGNRLTLGQRTTGSAYGEMYTLPVRTENITENKWYSILTSKNPVTVSQGGTGCRTEAELRTYLKKLMGLA